MKLYNFRVRVGGNILHEVPKIGGTEIEIRMMRKIHGDDAVVAIKTTGEDDRTEEQEMARLMDVYGEEVVMKATGWVPPEAPIADSPDEEDIPVAVVPQKQRKAA